MPESTVTPKTYYAGFDWAKDHHDVVIVDDQGQIEAEFQFQHSAAGWQEFRERTRQFPRLLVAIETSRGAAIEQLLRSAVSLYPLHPKSAKSYRARQLPSGTKTDRYDAWALADALRTDGHAWRPLAAIDPLVERLRLLCRDEVVLIEQRTALVNQLQQALQEYYPIALEAFDDWVLPAAWEFVAAFPTPKALQVAGRRQWEKFLHVHKLARPQTYAKRLEIFQRATQFCSGEAVTAAKSQLALSLVRLLRTLEAQLDQYRAEIERLFREHPDHDLFGSLPGTASKLSPRLLGEVLGRPDLKGKPAALQAIAGSAPVTFQSGNFKFARLRHQCNDHLRHTVHLWADQARRVCTWAAVYYQAHRAKGQSHADALRRLGNRLLKILSKMLETHTCYDAELHARNQQRHGSWVLKLQPAKP